MAYTVGLAEKGLPELVCFALQPKDIGLLDGAAELLRKGELTARYAVHETAVYVQDGAVRPRLLVCRLGERARRPPSGPNPNGMARQSGRVSV